MSKNNPWRGLTSYEDPAKNDKRKNEFCGRDEEALQLARLIDNSLFVTLYGRTGVGKTSLLRAGVFSVLRLHSYVPLYIRLSQFSSEKSYAKAIVEEIEKNEDIITKRINCKDLYNTDENSLSYLWDYFGQTKFYNQEEKEIYPVIVLDQFEEIFVCQEQGQKKKTEILLKQIHALLNDDFVILDYENFSDDTNYRFVASIREDNLFLLEDCIDENSLPTFKENRFRLRPMKEEQAKNVILIPGKRCIPENDKDKLVSDIIEAARDHDGTISSLMLSFICSQLYEKASKISSRPIINLRLFNEHKTESKKLLTNYYLQHTSKKQRKMIEEYYVTEDGHRKQSQIKIPHINELTNEYHILQDVQTEQGEGYEIVHDRLADVIYMHRRYRDSKKFRYALVGIVFVCLIFILCIAINLNWTYSMPDGNPGILALRERNRNINLKDTLVNEKIVTADFSYNDSIKTIIIGDDVDSISSLSISKKQEIIISSNNKKIKSDYIFSYNNYGSDSILYLYHLSNPSVALFPQKKVDNKDSVRLPMEVKSLQYYNYTWEQQLTNAPDVPHYGEPKIIIKNDRDLKVSRGDKRVKEIIVSGVKEIPDRYYEGCMSLEKVYLSSDELKLGYNCFKSCANLKEVVFPKKLKNNFLGEEFSNCFNLRKVILPDIVEKPEYLKEMFKWCPNLTEIVFSDSSHFHKSEEGIIFYDSIPAILSTSKLKDWENKDSTVRIIDAIVIYNGSQTNILPGLWEKDHYSILSKKNNRIQATGFIVYQNQADSVLNLPMISVGKYTYVNYNPILKEIHTPIADPNVFELLFPNMEDLSNVTLFVPYGCVDAYIDSGLYSQYKDIRQDTIQKRIAQTMQYWWLGIVWTFGALSWILYPIVILLLVLLAFVFYKLKMYQMTKRGILSRREALLYAIFADLSAVIGFIPVYYAIYWFATNHYKFDYIQICLLMGIVLLLFAYFVIRLIIDIKKTMLWPWLLLIVVLCGGICIYFIFMWGNQAYYGYECIALSSFYGGISGYMLAYLTVFAGNGKILNKIKRWKFSS